MGLGILVGSINCADGNVLGTILSFAFLAEHIFVVIVLILDSLGHL